MTQFKTARDVQEELQPNYALMRAKTTHLDSVMCICAVITITIAALGDRKRERD